MDTKLRSASSADEPVDPRAARELKKHAVELKTYNRWVNNHLSKRKLNLSCITTDFKDGVLLCHLLEILSGKTVNGWSKAPKNIHQENENVHLALRFMRYNGMRLVNIGTQDVVAGTVKLVTQGLGLSGLSGLLFPYEPGVSVSLLLLMLSTLG